MTMGTLLLFVAGIALLVAGAEVLVRGSSRLAVAIGITPLVVGLTVVAYGTSAPELAVSVNASLAGDADLAVGNVVGSNISNILLILGLSALAAPLKVSQQLVRIDVPVMIGIFITMFVMSWDGVVSRTDGIILVAGAIAYTAFAIRNSRRETREVNRQYQDEYDIEPEERRPAGRVRNIVLIVAGIFLLWLGSEWLVDSARVMAKAFGVSELVIGLTVVAVGTSLPELATSVVASLRGERDIAAGNVVGSNIFNVLSVLGLTAAVVPGGVSVAPAVINFDMPIMLAVAVACLPIFFSGHRIDRWEGGVFVFYYAVYTVYLILRATEHDSLPLFSAVMLWFVLPLTALTFGVVAFRTFRQRI